MSKIRILIADDHQLIRQGLESVLEVNNDIVIVGQVENGLEAVKQIENLKPDIALIDISMPKLNGLEVADEVLKDNIKTKILILSIYDHQEYILQSIEKGCSGYVLKNSDTDQIINAIRTIYNGGTYYGSKVSQIIVNQYLKASSKTQAIEEVAQSLTPREIEIVRLICEGLSTKEMATEMDISARTVEAHRNNVYKKLGVTNAAQLVRCAIKYDLIKVES